MSDSASNSYRATKWNCSSYRHLSERIDARLGNATFTKSWAGMAVNTLDYFIHDGADAFRLEIVGDRCGPAVAGFDQAWRTASSGLCGRLLIIGLVSLGAADENGRGLILGWYRIGAKIIARSEESRTVAEMIVGVPIPMVAPKPRLAELWREFLRGRTSSTSARLATANSRPSVSEHMGRRLPHAILPEFEIWSSVLTVSQESITFHRVLNVDPITERSVLSASIV